MNAQQAYKKAKKYTREVALGEGAVEGPRGPQGPPGANGIIMSVVPGTNITVDASDPANPVISSTATGGGSSTIGVITSFSDEILHIGEDITLKKSVIQTYPADGDLAVGAIIVDTQGNQGYIIAMTDDDVTARIAQVESTKANMIITGGQDNRLAEYVEESAPLNGGVVRIVQTGTPQLGSNTSVIGNAMMCLIGDMPDGYSGVGLLHATAADVGFFSPEPGEANLVENGIYWMKLKLDGGISYKIEKVIFDGVSWANPGETAKIVFPDSSEEYHSEGGSHNWTSNVLNAQSSRFITKVDKLDLKDVLYYREELDGVNFVEAVANSGEVANYNALSVFKDDVFRMENPVPDISAPVRVYSIDRNSYLRFNVNKTIDYVTSDKLQHTFRNLGDELTWDGYNAFDYVGIIGDQIQGGAGLADIEAIAAANVLSLTGKSQQIVDTDILSAVTDTVLRAEKTIQIKPMVNYTDIFAVKPVLYNEVWRLQGGWQDAPQNLPPNNGTVFYVDIRTRMARNGLSEIQLRYALTDLGLFYSTSEDNVWANLSGGGVAPDLSDYASKVKIPDRVRKLCEIGGGVILNNVKCTFDTSLPVDCGTEDAAINFLGGVCAGFGGGLENYMYAGLIVPSEADVTFFPPREAGQPLKQNGVYFIGIYENLTMDILQTIYDPDNQAWLTGDFTFPPYDLKCEIANMSRVTANTFLSPNSSAAFRSISYDLADTVSIRYERENANLYDFLTFTGNVASYDCKALFDDDEIKTENDFTGISRDIYCKSIDGRFYFKYAQSGQVEIWFDGEQVAYLSQPGKTWSALGFSAFNYDCFQYEDGAAISSEDADIIRGVLVFTGGRRVAPVSRAFEAVADLAAAVFSKFRDLEARYGDILARLDALEGN